MMRWGKKDKSIPLHQQEYVVLDTETTGFNMLTDRVISIGAVRMKNGQILLDQSFDFHVQIEGDLAKSAHVHGLTHQQLAHADTEAVVYKRLLDYVGSSPVVAHYASFDQGMLDALAKRNGLSTIDSPWLDTMDAASVLHPSWSENAEKLSLDFQLQHHDITAVARHTALGDAYSTALLFQKQLHQLQRSGITHSHQLRPKRTTLL